MIDGHGDDLWRFGNRIKYNFSTNIHSAFDHTPLMKVLAQSREAVTNYPEPEPLSVESALASIHRCSGEEVMVTNGATEAIYLIARYLGEGKSAIVSPTFREYQDACEMHNISVAFIGGLNNISDDCHSVWICNPNNPTGKVLPKDELLRAIRKHNDQIFIIDQAYSDYTSLPTLTAEEVTESGNVIMLGSLTKRFAVPGLRIGYALGNRELINRLKRLRMPWSVNGLAIKGALYLIDNIEKYAIDRDHLHSEALRITAEFQKSGIIVETSDCNFILCKLPYGSAAELKNYLANEAGILIRDASNFEGLDRYYFRVAAQSSEENDILIKNVRKWLATSSPKHHC